MSILTFGSSEPNARVCDVLQIGFITKDGNFLELELFVVPSIIILCQPFVQPIDLCVSQYQHLSDLDLNTCMEVDALKLPGTLNYKKN